MQEVVNLISSLGFPVFACIFLARYIDKREQSHLDELRRYNDALIRMEESAQRTEETIRQTVEASRQTVEAINRNTASMEQLARLFAKEVETNDH